MMPIKKKEEAVITKRKFDVKRSLIALGIGAIIGTVVWLVLDKNKVHQVICQIVGADQEAGVVAAKCLIK